MVYHEGMSQVLLFGGAQPRQPDAAGPDSAMWTWNGTSWQSHPSTLPPRANEAVAYDAARGRLIVHGGSEVPDETWEWDRRGWRLAASGGPGERGHHALTYDPVRKHVVLFGNNDRTPVSDTWSWDILLFGGRGESYFNDFWAFDGSWTRIPHTP
jgi:hypothetical protein